MTKTTCVCAVLLALVISTHVFSQVPVPVMELPGYTYSLTYSPDGKILAISISISAIRKPTVYTVKLWDAASGKEIGTVGDNINGINVFAWSPDSKFIILSTVDGSIEKWDVEAKKRVGEVGFSQNGYVIEHLIFHPDGKEFVSAGDEGKIQIWDFSSLTCVATLPGQIFRVRALAMSPDGRLLASAEGTGTIRLWDFDLRKCIAILKSDINFATLLAFSPDGKLLATCGGYLQPGKSSSLALWDVNSRTCIGKLTRLGMGVYSITFSPDSKFLVCGSYEKQKSEESSLEFSWVSTIFSWDVATKKLSNRIEFESERILPRIFRTIAFSPDGKLFAGGGDSEITQVWNAKDIEGEGNPSGEVEFGPDPISVSIPCEETVTVGDGLSLTRESVFMLGPTYGPGGGDYKGFLTLTFSPDGKILASAGRIGGETNVVLWDVETGRNLINLKGASGWLTELTFSPDGKYLAGCQRNRAWLWDVATGKLLKEFILYATDIAFSPDSSLIAIVHPALAPPYERSPGFGEGNLADRYSPLSMYVSGKWSVVVWDVNEKKTVREIALSNDEVKKAVFSANRKTIITVQKVRTDDENTPVDERSAHGLITFWDVATGEKIKTIEGDLGSVTPVAFDPTRNLLAVGGGKVWYEAEEEWDRILRARRFGEEEPRQPEENYWIRLWDLNSGKLAGILKGHTGNVNAIAFSPDGKLVVSGGQDNTLKFWDADSGKLLGSIGEKSYTVVKSIAFSPDGSILATFNRHESGVRLWKIIRTPADK